jgi:oxygen-dependent protoporphyrinogen oxidase
MHFNLQDEVLMTSKKSVAAKNRFIYYPDHLVRMPGPGINIFENISTVLFEPAFKNILRSMVVEAFRSKFQPDVDVSVGKFLTDNRFAPEAVDNILSAVFHGVYAGDVYQLSARSIVPRLFEIAVREDESLLSGLYDEMTRNDKLQPAFDRNRTKPYLLHYMRQRGDDESIVKVIDQVAQSSVYTFKRGIGQLAESIELYLARMENVTIVKNAEVLGLKYRVDGSKGKVSVNPIVSIEFN